MNYLYRTDLILETEESLPKLDEESVKLIGDILVDLAFAGVKVYLGDKHSTVVLKKVNITLVPEKEDENTNVEPA